MSTEGKVKVFEMEFGKETGRYLKWNLERKPEDTMEFGKENRMFSRLAALALFNTPS